MGVGTSLGAYFDDSFHQSAAQWDDKYDDNEYSTEGIIRDATPTPAANDGTLTGLITPVANITNTPGEIMDGLEGTKQYPSGFYTPEKVKSAALIHNGETYEDVNHGFALGRILDKYPDANMKNIKEGFTTDRGRFVSREEAFGIAKARDQIQDNVLPSLTKDSTMLLSEDLK